MRWKKTLFLKLAEITNAREKLDGAYQNRKHRIETENKYFKFTTFPFLFILLLSRVFIRLFTLYLYESTARGPDYGAVIVTPVLLNDQ